MRASLLSALLVSSLPAYAASPTAAPDRYCALQATSVTIAAPGLLANDSDLDGDPIAVDLTSVVGPANGSAVVRSDGSFDYAPNPGFQGTDTFTYRAMDASSTSGPASVQVDVAATRVVCQDASNFQSLLQNLGFATPSEGFEDEAVWGVSRTTAVTSVAHNGVTWRSNHAANKIRTSLGAAHSGAWGLYSSPHGDLSGGPTSVQRDGFRGDSSELLFGVGAWLRSNTPVARAALLLDETTSVAFPVADVLTSFSFFGVVDLGGFTSFEFYETEGRVEEQKYIFGDDFLFGVSQGADLVPPQVVMVSSIADTGDGVLSPGEVTSALLTQLSVTFDEPVFDPPGDIGVDDVTNPANYLLVEASLDGVVSTVSCAAGPDPADDVIDVSSSAYSNLVASFTVNNGHALPAGTYRLLVCGTTSIRDLAGNALDGNGDGTGGDDFALDFEVVDPPVVEPTVLLKVNGLHPDPPLVALTGPLTLTLTVTPGTVTETLWWYFAIAVGNQVYWVTYAGVSTSPGPIVYAPPTAVNDAPLVQASLPPGVTYTFAFFLFDGTQVRGVDYIQAVRP